MNKSLGLLVIVLSACAGHPSQPTPIVPAVTPATAVAAPTRQSMDAGKMAELQKAGFVAKNRNGQTVYCHKDADTGSHIQATTPCLTQDQWDTAHQRSQDALRQLQQQASQSSPSGSH